MKYWILGVVGFFSLLIIEVNAVADVFSVGNNFFYVYNQTSFYVTKGENTGRKITLTSKIKTKDDGVSEEEGKKIRETLKKKVAALIEKKSKEKNGFFGCEDFSPTQVQDYFLGDLFLKNNNKLVGIIFVCDLSQEKGRNSRDDL